MLLNKLLREVLEVQVSERYFCKTLIEIAKKDKNVHLLTGDLGFGVLKPYWEQLDQFANLGIAEQNMTSFAAGLALQGKQYLLILLETFQL